MFSAILLRVAATYATEYIGLSSTYPKKSTRVVRRKAKSCPFVDGVQRTGGVAGPRVRCSMYDEQFRRAGHAETCARARSGGRGIGRNEREHEGIRIGDGDFHHA